MEMTLFKTSPFPAFPLKGGIAGSMGLLGSASRSGSGDIIDEVKFREVLPKCCPSEKRKTLSIILERNSIARVLPDMSSKMLPSREKITNSGSGDIIEFHYSLRIGRPTNEVHE